MLSLNAETIAWVTCTTCSLDTFQLKLLLIASTLLLILPSLAPSALDATSWQNLQKKKVRNQDLKETSQNHSGKLTCASRLFPHKVDE